MKKYNIFVVVTQSNEIELYCQVTVKILKNESEPGKM